VKYFTKSVAQRRRRRCAARARIQQEHFVKRQGKTLGDLKAAEVRTEPVRDEVRRNLAATLRAGKPVFQGIVGYEHTVLPQIENALLARHDFILLGLRGQAKTRILRQLVRLLDEHIPVVEGCAINDDPYAPLCKRCRRMAAEMGDDLPVAWLGREARYHEKLATPDVTIADLIGDIDPIKAARDRLTFGDEEALHFGIVPRTHRGIFALNELPDLQPRIQVGLLNVMEERDFQIRGLPIRLPIDVLMVFSANPEDYTNRGNIITPLKDRIASQVLTHYPADVAAARAITDQESWVDRGLEFRVPEWYRDIVEQVAFEARASEFVDQKSGVSARLSIAAYENLVSNLERRGHRTGDRPVLPRVCDLQALVPAVSGKIELVYEGEQQGPDAVARHVIGQAVKGVFHAHFPQTSRNGKRRRGGGGEDAPKPESAGVYDPITSWFSAGNRIEISDSMPHAEYAAELGRVDGLAEVAERFLPVDDARERAVVMELVLEGLYQNSFVAKESVERSTFYSDMLMRMFQSMEDS
jgi:magnesium chelatase subunit I